MAPRLALIAGGGRLPRVLAEAAQGAGRDLLIVGLEGMVDQETLAAGRSCVVPIGAAGRLMGVLRDEGIQDVVFAGKVRRPSFKEMKPDWRGVKFLAKIGAKALGDDGIMRAIIAAFEEEGFQVLPVDQVMRSLLAPLGPLGRHQPDERALADIRHGLQIARILGQADVGQAVVVQEGLVLGVEAIEGTDQLIARVGPLHREGPGGVLVKIKKPQQDRRADLPTIGLATLEGVRAAGLRGIAIEAGATLVLDRNKLVEEADKAGLFIVGVSLPP